MEYKKHKLQANKFNKGVTLIELLVVITIMMTMMSLVAPLAINTIEKAEAQREYLSFCNLLRKGSVKAFANGSGINVELNGNNIQGSIIRPMLSPEDTADRLIIFTQTYQYLNFKSALLRFNQNGMANLNSITFTQRNIIKKIDIVELLEN